METLLPGFARLGNQESLSGAHCSIRGPEEKVLEGSKERLRVGCLDLCSTTLIGAWWRLDTSLEMTFCDSVDRVTVYWLEAPIHAKTHSRGSHRRRQLCGVKFGDTKGTA
jgi:hypothetical protein